MKKLIATFLLFALCTTGNISHVKKIIHQEHQLLLTQHLVQQLSALEQHNKVTNVKTEQQIVLEDVININ